MGVFTCYTYLMTKITCECPKCGLTFPWKSRSSKKKVCVRCGREFFSPKDRKIYCSGACSRAMRNRRARKRWTKERREVEAAKARNERLRRLSKNPLLREKERLNASLYWMKAKTENPIYRIRNYLRARIRRKVRTGTKNFDHLIGCTPQELKDHLQRQFDKGMSWDNYGTYWVVDHIQPLRLFDLLKEDQIRAACHFTNLQPLTEVENQLKAGQVTVPQMTMPL